MPEVVETNVRKACPLQQDFQLSVGGTRINELLRLQWIREYPLGEYGLFPFTENLYRTGWQHDLPNAGACLGAPGSQPAASFPVDGAADFQSAVSFIEVLPLESAVCEVAHQESPSPPPA